MVRLEHARRIGINALTACAISGATAPAALAGDDEGALFGPRYHSISVTRDGQPHELVRSTKLRVKFLRDGDDDSVTWHSGCNLFGAGLELADDLILIDATKIFSTDMACPGKQTRQDRFFARFFGNDPAWSIQGRRLTLNTERVVIELRRKSAEGRNSPIGRGSCCPRVQKKVRRR